MFPENNRCCCAFIFINGHKTRIDRDESRWECSKVHFLLELDYIFRTTKCELARLKNKESMYRIVLEKRDSVIMELDEELDKLEKATTDNKV